MVNISFLLPAMYASVRQFCEVGCVITLKLRCRSVTSFSLQVVHLNVLCTEESSKNYGVSEAPVVGSVMMRVP